MAGLMHQNLTKFKKCGWSFKQNSLWQEKTWQIWLGTAVEPCWLFHTCSGHQKSFPVFLTNTPLVPLHHEGAFKTICLLGCSFMGRSCTTDYCIILFKSVCFPPPAPVLAHPWLNNQKKVTFLRSDFHSSFMLGRHFQFPKTFHVTHPSTWKTTNTQSCGYNLKH